MNKYKEILDRLKNKIETELEQKKIKIIKNEKDIKENEISNSTLQIISEINSDKEVINELELLNKYIKMWEDEV